MSVQFDIRYAQEAFDAGLRRGRERRRERLNREAGGMIADGRPDDAVATFQRAGELDAAAQLSASLSKMRSADLERLDAVNKAGARAAGILLAAPADRREAFGDLVRREMTAAGGDEEDIQAVLSAAGDDERLRGMVRAAMSIDEQVKRIMPVPRQPSYMPFGDRTLNTATGEVSDPRPPSYAEETDRKRVTTMGATAAAGAAAAASGDVRTAEVNGRTFELLPNGRLGKEVTERPQGVREFQFRPVLALTPAVNAHREIEAIEAEFPGRNPMDIGRGHWTALQAERAQYGGPVGSFMDVGRSNTTLVAWQNSSPAYQAYFTSLSVFESQVIPVYSGAAVTDTEAARFVRGALPQPGDSARVMQQKARMRRQILNGVAYVGGQPFPFPDEPMLIAPGASADNMRANIDAMRGAPPQEQEPDVIELSPDDF